jgi:hypothetical protein
MAQQQTIGRVHTTRGKDKESGFYRVKYHETNVVSFDDKTIILDNGGHRTATTKTRMNQTSNEFDLGFHVYQEKGEWFVLYQQVATPYKDEVFTITRKER